MIMDLTLPTLLRGNDGPTIVRVLSRPPKGSLRKSVIWIDVEVLPWIIGKLSQQVQSGGVTFEPDPTRLTKPYWSWRDNCWNARARRPNGDIVRRSFVVQKITLGEDGPRRHFTTVEFEELKNTIYQMAEAWTHGVIRGDVHP